MASRCKKCEFNEHCQNVRMDGVGPARPEIMIVGDKPTWHDDKDGEPFRGDHGSKLDYLLKKVRLKRSRVFVTNAIKCAPPKNANVKPIHIKACQEHLFREILDARPKVIIAMGKDALHALTGLKDITEYRGYFQPLEIEYEVTEKEGVKGRTKTFKTQVVPTFSPNSCLTKWEWDDMVEHDMLKAMKYVATGQLPVRPKLDVEMVTSIKQLNALKSTLLAAKRFSFDFETTSLNFHDGVIVMAGFSVEPGKAWVVPYFEYTSEHMKKWTSKEKRYALDVVNPFVRKYKKEIRAFMKEVLESDVRKSAQNGKFDTKYARSIGIRVRNFDFDTIIAHALVDENKPHNLTFMLEWYGIDYGNYDHVLWKYVNKDRKNKKPYSYIPPSILADYLGVDVDGVTRLKPKLRKQMVQEGVIKLFKRQQMPLVHLLADIEFHGTKLNVEGLQKISRDFAGTMADIEVQLKKITKMESFNPNSPSQLCAYLEDIGAPLEKRTASGAYSVDVDTLEALARRKKWAKVPNLILELRSLSKLKSTYLDGKDGVSGMLKTADKNHMVHTTYNAFTPRTGRLASADPNLQNIPRPNPKYPDANIRKLFVPSRKGWVLISIDEKQIEMRVAAYLSGDRVMLKEIADKVDIHTRNAVYFGTLLGFLPKDMTEDKFAEYRKYKPPENWKTLSEKKQEKIRVLIARAGEYEEHRTFAKSLGFGLNYGKEASTLAKEHNRDVEEVQEAIDAYFQKYEGLYIWREEQKALWLEQGYLTLPETGRKRRFGLAADWFNHDYSKDCWKRPMDMEAINRQAMNFPIQGYANELFTQGKLKFYKQLKRAKTSGSMLMSNHDGILLEAPPTEVGAIKTIALETMQRVLKRGKITVPIEIDFDVYDCWGGNKLEIAA